MRSMEVYGSLHISVEPHIAWDDSLLTSTRASISVTATSEDQSEAWMPQEEAGLSKSLC